MRFISILTGLLLTGFSASGQNFQFISCSSNVVLRATISNVQSTPASLPGGQRSFSYTFMGSYSFSVNGVTRTSSGLGAAGILYTGLTVTAPFTTLDFELPNENGDGPGTGSARSRLAWRVSLQGLGDLLPNGLVSPLPAIGRWALAGGSTSQNYIFGYGQPGPLETFSGCTPNGKALGDPFGLWGGCFCGDPVNVATGNLFETVSDFRTAGTNRLEFRRYYNSQAIETFARNFGPNWRSNFDRNLRITPDESVIAERADGRQIAFNFNAGSWTHDPDVDMTLNQSGSTWTLTDGDTVETYRATGTAQANLVTIRARNGYTQTLDYDGSGALASVTDSFNRRLVFSYAGGLLRTVAIAGGPVINYSYGTGNRLTGVTYAAAAGNSIAYLYENGAFPNSLTGMRDENGNAAASWTYDGQGRVTSSQRAGGAELTRIDYDDAGGSRTVTFPLGARMTYRFATLQGLRKVTSLERRAAADAPVAIAQFSYDPNGFPSSRTNWNGDRTTYINDAGGRPIAIIEAAGTARTRTVAITYHPTFRLPVRIEEAGRTTAITYDANGNPLTRTITDTTGHTVPYSTAGSRRSWTYTWSNLLLTAIKGPRTDVDSTVRFTYDTSGRLTSMTDPAGLTSRITAYGPSGLPRSITDPNGTVTEFGYDSRLRWISTAVQTSAGPVTTETALDGAGRMIGRTDAEGGTFRYSYDAAGRLARITDPFDEAVTFSRNAHGGSMAAARLDARGNASWTANYGYDGLGRVVRRADGAGQSTTLAYDNLANVLASVDALDRVSQWAYDAVSQAISHTNASGAVTAIASDSRGQLTDVTAGNGTATTFVYDGFGQLIQQSSPDGGATVYRWDAAGNLIRKEAAGDVTLYTHDAANRLVSLRDEAGVESLVFRYDEPGHGFGSGRLTSVTDASGRTDRTYDEFGRITIERRVTGELTFETRYRYDRAGRLTTLTYPSGWTVRYGRDKLGRAVSASIEDPSGNTLPLVSDAAYLPFGPVQSWNFGNGIREVRTFDAAYRMTNQVSSGEQVLRDDTYSYDAAGNVLGIASAVHPESNEQFEYDAADRLTAASGSYGARRYTYDAAGNRLTETAGETVREHSYQEGTNRLVSIRQETGPLHAAYDARGSVSSLGREGEEPLRFAYLPSGRLASVSRGSAELARYGYDAFGKRVIRNGALSGTTVYVYGNGSLLQEADGAGSPTVLYVYMEGMPIAVVSPASGAISFLHGNRLGTPVFATGSAQSIEWAPAAGPFGEIATQPLNIVQNLRMPGQEWDIETGLYQNGYRDYIPEWGRYLEADPAGLAGGINPYTYASGNPLRNVDPLGLSSWCPNSPGVEYGIEGPLVDKLLAVTDAFGNNPVLDKATAVADFASGFYASDAEIRSFLNQGPINPFEFDAPKAMGIFLQLMLSGFQSAPPGLNWGQYDYSEYNKADLRWMGLYAPDPLSRASALAELEFRTQGELVIRADGTVIKTLPLVSPMPSYPGTTVIPLRNDPPAPKGPGTVVPVVGPLIR